MTSRCFFLVPYPLAIFILFFTSASISFTYTKHCWYTFAFLYSLLSWYIYIYSPPPSFIFLCCLWPKADWWKVNNSLVSILNRLLSFLPMLRQLIISPVWEQGKLTSDRVTEPFKAKRKKWSLPASSAPSHSDIIAWEQGLKYLESS